jgi:lysophospholipase L1-like esterase
MLKSQNGLDIEILNGGLPYATTAENLASYVFRYRYLKPDVVVIEAGGNDQVATWYPGYNAEYTHFRGPGGGWRFNRLEKAMLRSNVAKVLYCRWIVGKFRTYSAHPADYETLDRAKTLEMVRTNGLDGFRRNLDLLVKLATNDGCKVLLVGFVNGEQSRLSKNRPELKGFEPVIFEGTRRHRAALSEIGNAAGVKVVQPLQERFLDEMFTDDCHLTAAGERVKASECLPALLSLLREAGERRGSQANAAGVSNPGK